MANISPLTRLQQLLDTLDPQTFLQHGIEREALRVDANGHLARSPHPPFLGSKLCNPRITTDFSEAQLELITPVHNSIRETLDDLKRIHQFVYGGLDDQLLWAASMPCVLNRDDQIPLADYGTSNLGHLKKTYRNGLGLRYGRAMQTICAVHYNLSLSPQSWQRLQSLEAENTQPHQFVSDRYFDMMRNFRRFSWLLIYLFGASPALCKSFVQGRSHQLEQFDEGTLFLEHATSLRSGNLGYQSDLQQGLINICYNSLSNYTRTLAQAITTEHERYRQLGLFEGSTPLQINACILQSEAEFYTSIRAKRTPPPGVNFLHELRTKGVEYAEIRLLDLDPYAPLGISEEQVHFLDLYFIYCLLEESPQHCENLCQLVQENMSLAVYRGREPGLRLNNGEGEVTLKDWGLELMDALEPLAEVLDGFFGRRQFASSLAAQREKVEHPHLTPSARILQDMSSHSTPFFRFAMNQSLAHKALFGNDPLAPDQQAYFEQMARDSVAQQKE
ncbi:MAG: glutamate--cysteine ligase, partial [Gammaproteobacteria bacterium]|nr:glutamate--cysteine ligase [Gammaproteobacteria bacterium]